MPYKTTFLFAALPLLFACHAQEAAVNDTKKNDTPVVIDAKLAQNVVAHYFSAQAQLSSKHQPAFVVGDFNGDGRDDMAVLFQPAAGAAAAQVKISYPWQIPGSVQSATHHTSLVIINGGASGWLAEKSQVFALLDKSGVLETPSFQLQLKKKQAPEGVTALPVKSPGDLLVLPTEAGIDTYVYWNGVDYQFHAPAEAP